MHARLLTLSSCEINQYFQEPSPILEGSRSEGSPSFDPWCFNYIILSHSLSMWDSLDGMPWNVVIISLHFRWNNLLPFIVENFIMSNCAFLFLSVLYRTKKSREDRRIQLLHRAVKPGGVQDFFSSKQQIYINSFIPTVPLMYPYHPAKRKKNTI